VAQYCPLLVLILGSLFSLSSVAEDDELSFHRFWPDNLFAAEFVSEDVGFIAGYSGTVLRTTNAGQNWDAIYIGRNELIRRMSFVNQSTGWAVGHRGSIFHTKDAGQTWEVQKELPGVYLRDVDFADENNGWVVGHNANIWRTNDGGISWQQQQLLGFLGRDIPRLHGVYAKDADNAIVVGEFGVVAHTENAGEHWLLTSVESKVTWLSVAGAKDTAYVVGLDGEILRLSPATESQRNEIDALLAEVAAKKEAKSRAKAKRMKREFVKEKTVVLPRSEIEYFAESIETNSKEHLFDIAMTVNNEAIVVGRSTVLKLSDDNVASLKPDEGFPLPFIWMGGVSVTPAGRIWAPGIRGLVVTGDLNQMTFGQAFNLATSSNINLVSDRWGEAR